eukprot:snap_masked-scaffold_89-processed-gene-0.23-mRNA-1 protein AED:1.00 eAED:1.00 QI:0/-1/0/0/-1/1/1/0/673
MENDINTLQQAEKVHIKIEHDETIQGDIHDLLSTSSKRSFDLTTAHLSQLSEMYNQNILHLALQHSNTALKWKIIQIISSRSNKNLIEVSDLINGITSGGLTALHLCVYYNNIFLLKILIEHPAMKSETMNKKSENGCSPLTLSLLYGRIEAFQILMHCGAKIENEEYIGENNIFHLLPHFIQCARKTKNEYNGNTLIYCFELLRDRFSNDAELTQVLSQKNIHCQTILHSCIYYKTHSFFKYLVENKLVLYSENTSSPLLVVTFLKKFVPPKMLKKADVEFLSYILQIVENPSRIRGAVNSFLSLFLNCIPNENKNCIRKVFLLTLVNKTAISQCLNTGSTITNFIETLIKKKSFILFKIFSDAASMHNEKWFNQITSIGTVLDIASHNFLIKSPFWPYTRFSKKILDDIFADDSYLIIKHLFAKGAHFSSLGKAHFKQQSGLALLYQPFGQNMIASRFVQLLLDRKEYRKFLIKHRAPGYLPLWVKFMQGNNSVLRNLMIKSIDAKNLQRKFRLEKCGVKTPHRFICGPFDKEFKKVKKPCLEICLRRRNLDLLNLRLLCKLCHGQIMFGEPVFYCTHSFCQVFFCLDCCYSSWMALESFSGKEFAERLSGIKRVSAVNSIIIRKKEVRRKGSQFNQTQVGENHDRNLLHYCGLLDIEQENWPEDILHFLK